MSLQDRLDAFRKISRRAGRHTMRRNGSMSQCTARPPSSSLPARPTERPRSVPRSRRSSTASSMCASSHARRSERPKATVSRLT
jgi:hypothetical protein